MNPISAEPPDIRERSQTTDGRTLTLERRLFMQLLAFGESERTDFLVEALSAAELPGVLYEDVNDPTGVALLTLTENPDFFVTDSAVIPAPAAFLPRYRPSRNTPCWVARTPKDMSQISSRRF